MTALAAFACGRSAWAAEPPPACAGKQLGSGVVAAVLPQLTLGLTDGRRIHLMDVGAGGTQALDAALLALVGTPVALREGRGAPDGEDRHGRLPAQIFISATGEWLQDRLVRRGLVFVQPTVMSSTCTDALLATEATARRAGAGLWGDPARVADAAEVDLAVLEGRYGFVAGRVLSIGKTRRNLYLNFGKDWSKDVTVMVAARDLKHWPANRADLDRLTARKVLVRGVIEAWNGALIRVEHPAQIVAEED